jgi:hypothetical protein
MNALNNKYFTKSFCQNIDLNEIRLLTEDFQWGVSLRHMDFFGQKAPTVSSKEGAHHIQPIKSIL